jgi:hypothetical protein
MSVSTGLGAKAGRYELVPGQPAGQGTGLLRRRSAQPSRRAVLHVQAAGEPGVPADLAAWYTERALHVYVARIRLPGRALRGRWRARKLAAVFADLDAAAGQLRQADGIDSVIVTAHGRGAVAAALWRDLRGATAADALILYAPALAARPSLSLGIDCPVLVVSDAIGESGPAGSRLGAHVTWLRMAEGEGPQGMAEGADRRVLLRELGRWLGAYMYGQARDQLL